MVLAGCAGPQPRVEQAARPHWLAVLVAGDGSLPVFDNAVAEMAKLLQLSGPRAAEMTRFSAAGLAGTALSTRAAVLAAIAGLHPAAGQACFVFLTSHGAHGPGVYLAPETEFLSPADLAAALDAGCGDAPTVVVASACYTGGFAGPPLARPNRILLTAARADRPSFGCGAGRTFTYYDTCLLRSFTNLPRDWQDVINGTDQCVTRLEAREGEPASDPQSYVGARVAGLELPGGS